MRTFALRAAFGVLMTWFLAPSAFAAPIDVTYNVSGSYAGTSGCCYGVPFTGVITLRMPGGDLTVGGALDLEGLVEIVGAVFTATGDPVELAAGDPGDWENTVLVSTIEWPGGAVAYGGFSPMLFQSTGFSAEVVVSPGSIAVWDSYVSYPWGSPLFQGTDTATGSFSGTEVSRTLVPEPASASLVGLALAGCALAACGARRPQAGERG